MILRSIELENFGKFRGEAFELRRGMNLVLGQNEAGKSTLAEAIPAVLFGSRSVEQFKPWGRNACLAKLVFEGNNRTIEVQRNLLTDEVHLVERDDLYHILSEFEGRVPPRGRSAVYQKYYDLLENLLGISDEALFRATCFFGHRPQEWSGENLAQKLRTLVGGGEAESDYAQIMDQLLDEHFALTRVNPWGRDKQRDREYEHLCEQLAEVEAQLPSEAQIETTADPQAAMRIDELSLALEKDRDEYAKGVRYVEQVRAKVEQARLHEATASPSAEPEAVVTEPAVPLSVGKDLGLPDPLPEDLPQILAEAADIRQELANFQQPFAQLLQQERKIAKVPWAALGGLSVLPLIGAGLAWWQTLPLPIVLTVAAVILLCLVGWGGRRQLQRNKALAACATQRSRLEQQKTAVLQRQAVLTERCEALGLPSSAIDLVRLQKLIDKHQKNIGASPSPPECDQAGPADTAEGHADAGLTTDDTIAAEQDLADLEQRLAEFAELIQERELEFQSIKETAVQNEPVLQQAQPETVELNALRQRKAELEHRIAVLRTAIELLAEAVDEYAQSDLSALVEEVSRLFGKVTKGRYLKVRFDADMSPELQVDGRSWRPIERFSRGTVDAFYLALRVALAKVRGDGISLPLLLDDPFAHLDQRRLTSVLNILGLAATDGQLILLSHNQDLARRAAKERWHVISLGEIRAEAESDEDENHAGQLHLL